ncbi:MAG TPA: flavodoxin domain-containing protein [Kofleriaceae bacterium]|nr:flavodoxin domain-containing protein [Kofleriaceae bacterium]
MRVLVTWGSKRGGTAGIGRIIAEQLRARGHEPIAVPAAEAPPLQDIDAVIVGGALYANHWHRSARRFVMRHTRALRRIPVWMFSSGPLDDSADRGDILPPRQVRALMDHVGALGHITFGGRLEATARGLAVEAMAKEHAGDWRNPSRIRAWTNEIADALSTARPGTAFEPHGRSLGRLAAYGAVGWALCAATLTLALLVAGAPVDVAITLHATTAPLWLGLLARRYHRAVGARPPLVTALAWTAMKALADALLVANVVRRDLALLDSFTGFWLPLALAFLAAWSVGAIASVLPLPARAPAAGAPAGAPLAGTR